MDLDGARGNAEFVGGDLVRASDDELIEDIALARRQKREQPLRGRGLGGLASIVAPRRSAASAIV